MPERDDSEYVPLAALGGRDLADRADRVNGREMLIMDVLPHGIPTRLRLINLEEDE